MKKIVVLSGKGGVGKTSITASLALMLSKEFTLTCVDCDVDAPNLSLLFGLKDEDFKWRGISSNEKAFVKKSTTKCFSAVKTCYFNAINVVNNELRVNHYLCEGCGACALTHPECFELREAKNAEISSKKTRYGFKVFTARMLPGEHGSGLIVSKLKQEAVKEPVDLLVIDSAAGIDCPVIASVNACDHAVLVTEPTPAALSDLKKALQVVNHFNIQSCLIINKYDLNPSMTRRIKRFAQKQRLSVVSLIPYSKVFVRSCVNLQPVIVQDNGFEKFFRPVINNLKEVLGL